MVRPLHLSLALRSDRVLLVGNVLYADRVHRAIPDAARARSLEELTALLDDAPWDLIVVAGFRRLLPAWIVNRYVCVGFHSAKLPEYPGRAPIPWTLLRGDRYAWNTMLYLDEGIDSGDIIDAQSREIAPGDTPETLYEWIGESSASLLTKHLEGLLTGTAPRQPQDMTRRGALTTKDGWQLYGLGVHARR